MGMKFSSSYDSSHLKHILLALKFLMPNKSWLRNAMNTWNPLHHSFKQGSQKLNRLELTLKYKNIYSKDTQERV
jgi:hypothetical protein